MGILKKTRNSQKPPGYLTPNITDSLGDIPILHKTHKKVKSLGSVQTEISNITEGLNNDNIYTEPDVPTDKEVLSDKPDGVIISSDVILKEETDLGRLFTTEQHISKRTTGIIFDKPLKKADIISLGGINTDSNFIANISGDLGLVQVQSEAGVFTDNIVDKITNDTIIASNYKTPIGLSGTVFEQDKAGTMTDNIVSSINGTDINTGRIKTAVDLKISEINKEGKSADNIMLNNDILYPDIKPIEHSVNGSVFVNPVKTDNPVDGTVYNDIPNKSGEVISIGNIITKNSNIKPDLDKNTIYTDKNTIKSGIIDEIGNLDNYISDTKEIFNSTKLYENSDKSGYSDNLGTLSFDKKIGSNILTDSYIYTSPLLSHKPLEADSINTNNPYIKKELDRNESNINSGKNADNIVDSLETIIINKDNKTITKSLGSIY